MIIKMNTYTHGLVSVSFRKHSPQEILQAVKNAGLECIEWGSDIHAPADDINRLNEIVKLQKEYNIYCSSYGTYFKLGIDNLCELEKYIQAAKILGTNIIRLFCGDKSAEQYIGEEKASFLAQCKEAAKIAEKNDVIFCMECHNWSYTETAQGALELMKEVNSPAFRMYWQVNQFNSKQENLIYSSLLSPYCEHLHVFNWQGDNRYPLADATEIWKKYLDNFSGNKTLLLEFMPDDKLESLECEAKALFNITTQKGAI